MKAKRLLVGLGLLQAILGLRVVFRLLSTIRGVHVATCTQIDPMQIGKLSVIVPVLNEFRRLAACLDGLLANGAEINEILVVDGGSSDGTQAMVLSYQQRDSRVRLLDAHAIPAGWNGKAWSLQLGSQQAAATSDWLLTLDADVRPGPWLVRSLLAHAKRTSVAVLSLATLQDITGFGQGLLHPSLLTTLVYRFGIPGYATRKMHAVQANGQCFLVRRDVLASSGGFAVARASRCEDVTTARALAAAGQAVGFYEAGALVRVQMYEHWRETWQNWPRSLPMHDQFSRWQTLLGWLEITLVQALPLPMFVTLFLMRRGNRRLWRLNTLGMALRLGVLCGTARAYCRIPWSYWFSPLCDLPVVFTMGWSILRRRQSWRGRVLVQNKR